VWASDLVAWAVILLIIGVTAFLTRRAIRVAAPAAREEGEFTVRVLSMTELMRRKARKEGKS